MKRQNKHPLKQQAFTLIELLVVISVISMLVAILLPALASARQSAQGVQCLSNLKQIGVTYAIYGMDWKGYAPNANDQTDSNGIRGLKSGYENALEILMTEYGNGAAQMLYCPTPNLVDDSAMGKIKPQYPWNTYNSSYGINARIATLISDVDHHNAVFGFTVSYPLSPWKGVRIDDINHSGQRMAVADAGDVRWVGGVPDPSTRNLNWVALRRGSAGTQYGGAVSRRHLSETTNVLLVDGHAKNVPMREVQQPTKPEWKPTGWNYWGGNKN